MPKKKSVTVYQFDELSDKAKEKAREWYREGAFDYEWWDYIEQNAKDAAKYMGIRLDKMYFSGFSSQGDGACFEGYWYAADTKPQAELKADFSSDVELHRLAGLFESFAKDFPEASFSVKHSGHYSHKYCTEFEFDGLPDNAPKGTEDEIIEAARDLMQWIYKSLEEEYDYLNSNESVDDTIQANNYEFTEDGRRYQY